MNITRKSRGTEFPKQAQRVFLMWNENNIAGRDTVIEDLTSMDAGIDCVVSYLENPESAIDEEQLQNELLGTQLLVMWVTLEMLQVTILKNLPVEYIIAKELHIPILPILEDDGLFPLYKERFGSIHCIAKLDNEYRIKLKTQLEKFIASDEIIQRIREKAFTSKVFVSYRKHELNEARRFMKAFHDLEGFESISIWYDNFLTTGRDFDEDIEKSITNCNALALVVTPDMATEGNYVQKKEYPFARKTGKPVIPIEVIPTSQEQFSKSFPDAESPISLSDVITLQATFHNVLKASSCKKEIDSECAYLLGMAYLRGIDVERDFDRAVHLLLLAAEDETMASITAADCLASIYKDGMYTSIDYAKALQWLQNTSLLCEKVLGKDHPDTANSYNNIAGMYSDMGKYEKALEWYEKALVISEHVLGKDHLDIATAYNNIALVYSDMGKYEKALEWYEKDIVISERILGKEHPSTAVTYNNIALVYSEMGEYEKALEWYKKALVIRERVLGKEHPDTATTYHNIASVYSDMGKYEKALEWNEKALVIKERVLGKEHPLITATYNSIALVYSCMGEYDKALEWNEKALVIVEHVLGKEHPNTATTYNNIAVIYSRMGEYDKALEWYEKDLVIVERVLGKEHPDTATTYNNIAGVYSHMGEYDKALEWYEKDLMIVERVLGKEHPDTATTYNNIAFVYDSMGEYDKALEWHEKALMIRECVLGKEHPDTASSYNNLASVYYSLGEYEKALPLFHQAFFILIKRLGTDHPNTQVCLDNMSDTYTKAGRDKMKFIAWLSAE